MDAASDSGIPNELCDRVAGESRIAMAELVFDTVTQTTPPFVPNPFATVGSILTSPRYDVVRMPWIERDEVHVGELR